MKEKKAEESLKKIDFTPSTKNEKILRWILIAVDIAIALAGIGLAIYYKVAGDPNMRFLASLGILAFAAIPFAYELISRSKLPNSIFALFNIYLIITGIWGSALNGYYHYAWLDIVVHFIMGYLMAALWLFFLCRTKQHTKMHFVWIALFCVFFSLFVECVWEMAEWTVDSIAGQTSQGIPPEGFTVPLVTDTMEDIACNFGGAILFLIHYLISKFTKKNLLITSMENEFTKKHHLFEKRHEKLAAQNNSSAGNIEQKNTL